MSYKLHFDVCFTSLSKRTNHTDFINRFDDVNIWYARLELLNI